MDYSKGELTSDNVTNLGSKMNFWGTAYASIRSINIFFDRIEESPVEASIKDRMIGEMKFIRSFVYANLIWRYGGVPLIMNVFDLNQDYTVSRDSYENCVDFIVKELDEAIALLPAKMGSDSQGRASGDACKALKARVLLYAASEQNNPDHAKEKWEKHGKRQKPY